MPSSARAGQSTPQDATGAKHLGDRLAASRTKSGTASALVASGRFRSALGFAGHLLVALSHGGFAGEPNPAFFIHAQALDPDFIAHLDDVFGLLDSEVGQLADVDQAVFAWQKFDERAEVLNGDHLATVDFADFGLG